MIKKCLVIFFCLIIASQGEERCIYKDSIKLKTNTKIKKIKINNEYSVGLKNRLRKCIVDFDIKIKKWHNLKSEYIFDIDVSEKNACLKARNLAIGNFIENNFENLVTNIQLLDCSDDDKSKNKNLVKVNIKDKDIEQLEKNKNIGEKGFFGKIWDSIDNNTRNEIINSLVMVLLGV